jgi:ABC-type iron transport system FetAB permease component
MRMPRPQDILFGILGLVVIGLMAFHIEVVVLALVGAFACGAIYLLAGMIPSRAESLGHRVFITVFLSLVLSSLVLILPGTFGAHAVGPEARKAVIAIAGLLPLAAVGFEVVRTPRVFHGILRCLGYR